MLSVCARTSDAARLRSSAGVAAAAVVHMLQLCAMSVSVVMHDFVFNSTVTSVVHAAGTLELNNSVHCIA
jgi:hypothetical protein